MKVITVGREFGSGGREFGRRLAQTLGIAYYDKEIIEELSKRTKMSEDFVSEIVEKRPVPFFPITIGRSFYPMENPIFEQSQEIFRQQTKIIQEMAKKSDCVIVGRCGDDILEELDPIRIFIYAGMESRIKRCRLKASPEEGLSAKEMKKKINEIDKERSKYYGFYTGKKWGDPLNYDYMINTSFKEIKELVHKFSKIV